MKITHPSKDCLLTVKVNEGDVPLPLCLAGLITISSEKCTGGTF